MTEPTSAATVEVFAHDDGWGSSYAVSCSACRGIISTFAGDPKRAKEAATNDCESHRIWHGTRV